MMGWLSQAFNVHIFARTCPIYSSVLRIYPRRLFHHCFLLGAAYRCIYDMTSVRQVISKYRRIYSQSRRLSHSDDGLPTANGFASKTHRSLRAKVALKQIYAICPPGRPKIYTRPPSDSERPRRCCHLPNKVENIARIRVTDLNIWKSCREFPIEFAASNW